jgi:hypothetical protein
MTNVNKFISFSITTQVCPQKTLNENRRRIHKYSDSIHNKNFKVNIRFQIFKWATDAVSDCLVLKNLRSSSL